jgi:hypothetical protein
LKNCGNYSAPRRGATIYSRVLASGASVTPGMRAANVCTPEGCKESGLRASRLTPGYPPCTPHLSKLAIVGSSKRRTDTGFGACRAKEVSQASMGPPGQVKDGRADPSDLQRYRAAPFSEAGGGSTSAKKRFDRAGSTALSRGKELRVFSYSARSVPPGQAGHSPSGTFWRTVGFSRDRQSLIGADVHCTPPGCN